MLLWQIWQHGSAWSPLLPGGAASAAMAAVLPSVSAGDAVGAELEALGAGSSFGRGVGRGQAVVAAASAVMSSSPADEKFAARFRMQPISEAEVDQHGAAVLVSGPRGVHITQVPARCTVGQLSGSRELSDAAASRLAVAACLPCLEPPVCAGWQ